MSYSEVSNRIERAIDEFETAVQAGPENDDYYYTLVEEITNAVDSWLLEWNHTTALDGEYAGEILAQEWRQAMCREKS